MSHTYGMTVATLKVSVTNIPKEAVDFLRPHAVRAGHGDSDAAVLRWALLAHEQVIRRQLEAEFDQPTNRQAVGSQSTFSETTLRS